MISALPRALLLVAFVGGTLSGQGAASATDVKIYKRPTCGCCALWAKHLEKDGFRVSTIDQADLDPIKKANRVPVAVQTCHTALIDGYVIEGHVPLDAIRKLLRERPKIAGLAVAGMPIGSPGMEMGSRQDPYDVLAFTEDGKTTVYMKK
jgi:hypothetical protein